MKTRVSIILNIILLLVILFATGMCMRKDNLIQDEKEKASYIDQQLIQERDKKGRLVSSIKSYQSSYSALRRNKGAEIVALKKEVKNLKDLESISRLDYSLSGNFKVPAIDTTITSGNRFEKLFHQADSAFNSKVDSSEVNAISFQFADGFLKTSGYCIPGDSCSINYSYRDRFTLKKEWKRPKWNKSKELVFSAHPENPNASFTDLQDITIKPPPKKWYETRAFSFAIGALTGFAITR